MKNRRKLNSFKTDEEYPQQLTYSIPRFYPESMIEPSSPNYQNETNYNYTENTNTNQGRQSFLTQVRKSSEFYNDENLTNNPNYI